MSATSPDQSPTQAMAHTFDAADENAGQTTAAAFRAGIRAGRYPVVPDALSAALDAREHLNELQAHLYDDAPNRAGAARSLLDALVRREDVSAALEAAVDGQQDLDRRDIAASLVRAAQRDAEGFLRQAIADALPEILSGLREQLDATVQTLREAYTEVGALDVHQPDPMLVAQATEAQREALVTIAEETKAYRRIRLAQRVALAASSLRVPGDDGIRITSWREFFATGVHEVSNPAGYGLPGEGQAPRTAVRTVLSRSDVWLPDPDQLVEAYEQLQTVLHAHAAEEREAAARRAAELAEDSRLGRPARATPRRTVGGAAAAAMGLSHEDASHMGELRDSRR